jgi:Undecaprenyl-phosphate glucose phosphotransferase
MKQASRKVGKTPSAALGRIAPARPRRGARATGWRRWIEKSAPAGFLYLAVFADAAAIFGAALICAVGWGALTSGVFPEFRSVLLVAAAVASFVALWTIQKGDYDLKSFLKISGQASRAFSVWNFALLGALALGFATKTTADFSRGAVGLFYLVGLATLTLERRTLAEIAAAMRRARIIPARRAVAIGFEDCLATLRGQGRDHDEEVEFVSLIALRDSRAYLADDLTLAAAAVRMYRPDEVYIAIPWSRPDVIEECVDALIRTPAEIHLATDGLLERFGDAKVSHLGDVVGLTVTRAPLTRLQQWEKRAFDLVVATAALVALSPFLLVVAALIRWDSPGPAMFRQKRYGFNQEPFRIFKFRSMRAMDDGARVEQATRADPRVTRIGAFLRRRSIDELPQLLNVLKGEMSIVGPRPHALAHDQSYVERIASYARRHNVKPGITGWAQVHGYRGEIANDQEMQSRLEHDLYYVDNWSLWLDLKIILMTVFSSRAHKNAY